MLYNKKKYIFKKINLIQTKINYYSILNLKKSNSHFPKMTQVMNFNENSQRIMVSSLYEINILWSDWKLSNKKLNTIHYEYINHGNFTAFTKKILNKTNKLINILNIKRVFLSTSFLDKKILLKHMFQNHNIDNNNNIISNSNNLKQMFNYNAFLNLMEHSFSKEMGNSYNESNSGIVIGFKDAVVTISGLLNVQLNEMIRFEGGASGLILSLEETTVRGIVFTGAAGIVTGTRVYRTNNVMVVGVGDAVLGRVVNALGEPLDGKSPIAFSDYMRVERKAPGVITRKKVSEPLITGLKIVDALVPIGKGQRELILGDRKTGKTTIAIDTILNQRLLAELGETALFCFYVAVGKRMSEIMRIAKMLNKRGSMAYTTIVGAPASDPASLQYLAPYTACTMAEFFTYRGGHSLIIYDDLSKHADAYRQLALLLRRPVGREAYPGDVFYLHSRLLERAVKMNADYLSGSLTALPVVETVQGDVSAYIPTNVISITDGQIYLDLNLHQEGVRPAVDAGLSVSRVGSSAQYKSMKALAGSLKLELAQYREVAQFSKFGSELDAATRKILSKGKLLIEILKQPRNLPLVVYKQVLLLFAASSGFLDILSENGIALFDYERSLYTFLDASYIVLPFKRYIALNVDKDLFSFFLYYHYDLWIRLNSVLITKTSLNFAEELNKSLFLNFRYTLLIKRNFIDLFSKLSTFNAINNRILEEIHFLIKMSQLKNPIYSYFITKPKKHLLIKCYKDVLKIN